MTHQLQGRSGDKTAGVGCSKTSQVCNPMQESRKPIATNYIPEKVSGNIMFSSATQPPPRHNFVVSAITFEAFKLNFSNLKHALLIQISRTSSIIDIVVPSKMAADF